MPVYPLYWGYTVLIAFCTASFAHSEEAVAAFSWTVGFPTQMILLGREEIQTWSKDFVCVFISGFFCFFWGFFCWHIIHGNIIKWGKNWHNLTLVSATCARLQKSRGAQVTEALQIWCDIKLSTRGKHKNNKLCYLSHIFVWECLSLFCFFANKIFDTNYYKQINKCNNS